MRKTDVQYRDWSLLSRIVENLYRLTHHGKIRTLVLSDDQIYARDHW
jgi:hypothetical protein